MDSAYNLIVCIVNAGFSEAVMNAARSQGARGGTIISARGTVKDEAATLFNIPIHPEKDMVYIIVPRNITDKVLHELYNKVGLSSNSQGIAFSLPIDNVIGIGNKKED